MQKALNKSLLSHYQARGLDTLKRALTLTGGPALTVVQQQAARTHAPREAETHYTKEDGELFTSLRPMRNLLSQVVTIEDRSNQFVELSCNVNEIKSLDT